VQALLIGGILFIGKRDAIRIAIRYVLGHFSKVGKLSGLVKRVILFSVFKSHCLQFLSLWHVLTVALILAFCLLFVKSTLQGARSPAQRESLSRKESFKNQADFANKSVKKAPHGRKTGLDKPQT
jgi:hypothetical protein